MTYCRSSITLLWSTQILPQRITLDFPVDCPNGPSRETRCRQGIAGDLVVLGGLWMTVCSIVSQQTNRVYTGALGPPGVVPYTHGKTRGIGVVGVI